MEKYTLVIGNKNYSSWSMRAWVAMRHSGIDFDEEQIPLDREETAARLGAFRLAPPRVPMLRCGGFEIWDSLAILEFLHERHPAARLLPEDPLARARARSVSAEMHAGFVSLRTEVPMNIRRRRPISPGPDTLADIARVESLWQACLETSGGPFLFGDFGMADAMYAPVLMRLLSIAWSLEGSLADYASAVLDNAAVAAWMQAAASEPWVIEDAE